MSDICAMGLDNPQFFRLSYLTILLGGTYIQIILLTGRANVLSLPTGPLFFLPCAVVHGGHCAAVPWAATLSFLPVVTSMSQIFDWCLLIT